MGYDGTLTFDTKVDTGGFGRGISEITGMSQSGYQKATKTMLGITGVITGIGSAAVKTATDFDSQMSRVSAISGATGNDFDALRKKAREMGSKTKFSATEAGEAMEYMAMAGWKTEDMLEGIDGIMNLAAAAGEDLGTTSDIVTDALTAFGLSASDSGHFADILASASANANTNVSMLGESFKYVAPVAGSLGMSAEDTSVALGLMANAGIKASMGGTSLRNILTRLAKPTKEVSEATEALGISLTDEQGNVKDLNTLMLEMRDAFDGCTEAQKAQYAAAIAGKGGMSGLLAIVNATDEDYRQLYDSIYSCSDVMVKTADGSVMTMNEALATGAEIIETYSGAAEQMASTMLDNLGGKLTILKSALQELAISVGDTLVPIITKVVEKIQGWVDKFNSLDEGTKETIVQIGLFIAAVGPALLIVGKIIDAIQKLHGAFQVASSLIGGFVESLGTISLGPLALGVAAVVGGIAIVNGGLEAYYDRLHKANEEVYETIEASEACRKKMEEAGEAMGTSFETAEESIAHATTAAETATEMVDELEALYSANQMSNEQMQEAKVIVDQLNALYPGLNAEVDEHGRLTNTSTTKIREFIEEATHLAEVAAYEQAVSGAMEELTTAIQAKVDARVQEKAIAEQLEVAEQNLADAQERASQITEEDIDVNMQGATVDLMRAGIIGDKAKVVNDLAAEQENLIAQEAELDSQIAEQNERIALTKEVIDELKTEYGLTDEQVEALNGTLEEGAEDLNGYGEAAAGAEGAVEELALTAEQAYQEMYESALESVNSQIGLFDEMSTQYDTSIASMIAAQESQVTAMNQYYDNLSQIWSWAVQNGDESARAYVRSLADMGIDGAGHVQALAQSIKDGTGDMQKSVELFTQTQSIETEKAASLLAQIQSDTIETTDGIVYAFDYAGEEIKNSISETGDTSSSDWNDTMGSMQSTTEATMDNIASEVDTGMNDTENTVSNSRGDMESATTNTMDGMEAKARMAAGNMKGYGAEAMSNFESGMWSEQSGVESCASYIISNVSSYFSSVGDSAYSWGYGLGVNFANGVNAAGQYAIAAAASIAAQVAAFLHHSTPDKGPLRDDDKWGAEFAENIAEGMMLGAREVENAANEMATSIADYFTADEMTAMMDQMRMAVESETNGIGYEKTGSLAAEAAAMERRSQRDVSVTGTLESDKTIEVHMNLYLDKTRFAEEITPAVNHEMYKIDEAANNRGRGN